MRRRVAALLLLATAVPLLPACTKGGPKMEVRATLDEYSIELSRRAEDEGTVRIFIDNVGEKEHTLLFARVRSPEDLPRAQDGSVDVGRILLADRLEAIGPGPYRIQPDLKPGPLVIFCNLVTDGVSHFAEGMVATFDVRRTRESDLREGNTGPSP